jgi:hypothetical protein
VCGQQNSQNSVDATRRTICFSVSQARLQTVHRIPFGGGSGHGLYRDGQDVPPDARWLGLLCILNAGLGLLVPGIPYRTLWITDGVLKIAAGSSMVWLSY